MDIAAFTAFDFLVIGILIISTAFAFLKGFTSVALSLAAWAGALMVTVLGFAPLQPHARDLLQPAELADILALALLFIGSLILLKLIAEAVGNAVKSSAIGFLDRSLGALFGLLRGLVIVSVVYLGFAALLGDSQPDWVRDAKTKPLVAWGAEMVESLAGTALGVEKSKDPLEVLNESFQNTRTSAEEALNEVVRETVAKEAAKYTKENQDKLDDLFKEIEKKKEEKEDDGSR